MLGGCIPPGAVPVEPPPPVVPTTTAPPPRLELDLSQLRDESAIWALRPVAARPVISNGRRFHIVAAGETGIAIARAYGVAWTRIVDANVLSEPFVLRVGQRLILPAAPTGIAAETTPEARAAAFQIGIDDLVTGSTPAQALGVTPPAPARTAVTATSFFWPLTGAVTRRFGPQGNGQSNQGIDIAAAPGTGVRATSAGTIAYVGNGVPGYGGLILVRHDGGWISAYGRIATAIVAKGDVVSASQLLGKTAGEPLHFELRRARVPVNPVNYLPAR